MVARISRVLTAGVVVASFVCVQPAALAEWSLPNLFGSSSKSTKKSKKPITKVAKKEPTMLDKLGTGTKSFFDKTGETLGLKKPEPKKFGYATPSPRNAQTPKKTESKSWLPSPLAPEEPKKPKTVEEWMSGNKRLDL
jgi:hypothetical protein